MQNQLHTLDPSLRSSSLLTSPKTRLQSQYQEPAAPPNFSPLQPSPGNSYQSIQTPSYFTNPSQARESPDEQSPTALNAHDPNDLKRPRACEACRQLKVKCEFDDASLTGSCKRCAKANRQCIVTIPSRKRQKKTDSRVAELEKKIDALTASLAARGGHDSDVALDPAIARSPYQQQPPVYGAQWQPNASNHGHVMVPHSSPSTNQVMGEKRKREDVFGGELQHHTNRSDARLAAATTQTAYNESRQNPVEEILFRDVIDQGIIDFKTARQCFDRYNREMCQQLPIVVFPSSTSADEVRKTKPILFTAIVGVASGTIQPNLQAKLISEATKTLAERIVYNGEKSLELVQTIQVMTVFYQPPERYEELNFNQLIHIAAVMALDIGMGKRVKQKGAFSKWRGYMDKNKVPDLNAAETRRCWLGCYYMCSNSAMSLRRPLLVRWSPYADECLEILETASDALPTDKWLCYAVKAQRIAEHVGARFYMDDPIKEVSLTDPNVQSQLQALERDLEKLRQEATSEMAHSAPLQHSEAIVDLYMHEIAMHNEHNVDDFRPPYHATPIEGPPDPESVTPIHMQSLTSCLNATHAAFDAFLSMDVNLLRSLPTHFFVRTSYAAVALIKMYTAIAAKGSKFSAFFKADDLKVDYYLDRLISTVTRVAEGGMSKVAYKFSLIFTMLKSWHVRRTESPSGPVSREESQQRGLPRGATSRALTYANTPAVSQDRQKREQVHQHQQEGLWMNDNRHRGSSQPRSGQRNGLQMLSDAAMAPDAQQNQQGQWMDAQSGLPQANHPSQQIEGHNQIVMQQQSMDNNPGMLGALSTDPGTMAMAGIYGLPNDQVTLMDFTSDELMAYGFGDEFMAMNFGFDQGLLPPPPPPAQPPPPPGQGGWAI